jgi:hypothetical protein
MASLTSWFVSLGTLWKAPAVRAYFAATSPDQAELYASMPAFQVGREAQSRVNFAQDATRLKALFGVITGGSPFADDEAERLCLDMATVRNIIAHAGGWPTEGHVITMRSPNVLVTQLRHRLRRMVSLRRRLAVSVSDRHANAESERTDDHLHARVLRGVRHGAREWHVLSALSTIRTHRYILYPATKSRLGEDFSLDVSFDGGVRLVA